MSGEDRYLSRLDRLGAQSEEVHYKSGVQRKKAAFEEKYKGLRKTGSKIYEEASLVVEDLERGEGIERVKDVQDVQEYRAIARATYVQAKKDKNVFEAINAAFIYSKIGKPHIGMSKLFDVAETVAKERPLNRYEISQMRNFIKELSYSKKEKKSSRGLEGRVGVFILTTLAGIILSFNSLMVTGNAISNLTGTTQGLTGILLFIVGLTGMFFHFNKN